MPFKASAWKPYMSLLPVAWFYLRERMEYLVRSYCIPDPRSERGQGHEGIKMHGTR